MSYTTSTGKTNWVVRIPNDMYEKLSIYCERTHQTKTSLIREVFIQYLTDKELIKFNIDAARKDMETVRNGTLSRLTKGFTVMLEPSMYKELLRINEEYDLRWYELGIPIVKYVLFQIGALKNGK